MAKENKEPPGEEEEAEAAPEARFWRKRLSLALSAFIMSLTIALINAFHAVRGAEIVVLPPDQVVLYRDGEGEEAVLAFAMRLPMINAASSQYGDVMLEAELQPRDGGPVFRYQSLVQPIFTDDPEAAKRCPVGTRCMSLPGLMVVERTDEIVDIAGGSAHARVLSFVAAGWNCEGAAAACQAFGTFNLAVEEIGGKPLDLTIRLRFYGDGEREIDCRTGEVDPAYLGQIGWMAMSCEGSEVTGAPLL